MSVREQSLRETPGSPASSPLPAQPDGLEAPRTERERVIVCAACRARITTREECIVVNGAHSHSFLNPAGLIYRIGCFGAAPGAAGLGEPSDHWTWFAGFHWQTCICSACFEHLGWRFQSAARTFFGLITERLLELDEHGASN